MYNFHSEGNEPCFKIWKYLQFSETGLSKKCVVAQRWLCQVFGIPTILLLHSTSANISHLCNFLSLLIHLIALWCSSDITQLISAIPLSSNHFLSKHCAKTLPWSFLHLIQTVKLEVRCCCSGIWQVRCYYLPRNTPLSMHPTKQIATLLPPRNPAMQNPVHGGVSYFAFVCRSVCLCVYVSVSQIYQKYWTNQLHWWFKPSLWPREEFDFENIAPG